MLDIDLPIINQTWQYVFVYFMSDAEGCLHINATLQGSNRFILHAEQYFMLFFNKTRFHIFCIK